MKRRTRCGSPWWSLLAAGLFAVLSASTASALPKFRGERIRKVETLREVYFDVVVREVGPRTLVFQYSGGMGSVPLKDLPTELREHFGYDPAKEGEESRRLEAIASKAPEARKLASPPHAPALSERRFDRLARAFTKEPILLLEMDLRPRLRQMELKVKRQGRRPSCAVFSVVSALEYLNAEACGRPESLSEEYLTWATAKVTGRIATGERQLVLQEKDYGFMLQDVVAALRAYGVPSQERMPNAYSGRMAAIAEPSADLIAEARGRLRVTMHPLPHGDLRTMILSFVHILNEGVPFCVGMNWPSETRSRSAVLDKQPGNPYYTHAVALVGYRCPDGTPESLRFIFKNSWGESWGMGGYGEVSYAYLSKYLLDVLLLEVG